MNWYMNACRVCQPCFCLIELLWVSERPLRRMGFAQSKPLGVPLANFFISHVAQIVYIVGVQHGFAELPKFISNAPGLVEKKVTVPGNCHTWFLSELAAQTTQLRPHLSPLSASIVVVPFVFPQTSAPNAGNMGSVCLETTLWPPAPAPTLNPHPIPLPLRASVSFPIKQGS